MPNGMQVTNTGNGPAGQTSVNAAIPAASTQITFVQPASNFFLNNLSGSANLYFVLGIGTATTSSAGLLPGQPFNYNGPPVTGITIIGSAASGNYALLAY